MPNFDVKYLENKNRYRKDSINYYIVPRVLSFVEIRSIWLFPFDAKTLRFIFFVLMLLSNNLSIEKLTT